MDLCLYIPEDKLEISLYRVEADGRLKDENLVVGPLGLDPQALAKLDAAGIRQFFLTTKTRDAKFVEFGRLLHQALIPAQLETKWKEERGRTTTHFVIEHQALRELPLELLQSTTDYHFIGQGAPCVRCAALPDDLPKRPAWPVYFLIINGARPDDQAIQTEEEVTAILDELRPADHLIHCEVIETANWRWKDPKTQQEVPFSINALTERINGMRPHVLHFIGHSVASAGDEPAKLLCWDGKTYQFWTEPQIRVFLQNTPTLCLTYLNACRTQQAAANAQAEPAYPFSLAETFLRKSLAVVALQADVTGTAAALCARTFYGALCEKRRIDRAMAEARVALFNEFQDNHREPYSPSLILRSANSEVLSARSRVEAHQQENWHQYLGHVRDHFVDQKPLRRKLFDAFFGEDMEQLQTAVYVLGKKDTGKTWLLKRCLHAFALQDYPVKYVSPAELEPLDWLEVARRIAQPGGDGDLLSKGLPDAQLRNFVHQLNQWSRGEEAGEPPDGPIEDSAGPLVEIVARKPMNDFSKRVLTALRLALEETAGGKTFILVLDGWVKGRQAIDSVSFKQLKDHLLDPIAQDKNTRVKIMLAFDNDERPHDEWAQFETLGFLKGFWKEVAVAPFPPDEVVQLGRELLRLQFKGKDTRQGEEKLMEMGEGAPNPMKAGDLYRLCRSFGTWWVK